MTVARSLACLAVVLASLSGGPARAAEVDLALVLAVDVSSSIDEDHYALQIRGYAEAFRHPLVANAIRQGPNGAIAVALAQWADYGRYRPVIGWTVVRAATARRFAGAIVETTRVLTGSTSVSGAIDFSVRLLRASEHRATRRVIDISGNGRNNNGRIASTARDDAIAAGITINGLPILVGEPLLDVYYREQVIGGPGAFLIAADDFESFSTAILSKLVMEIAGPPATAPGPERQLAMLPLRAAAID